MKHASGSHHREPKFEPAHGEQVAKTSKVVLDESGFADLAVLEQDFDRTLKNRFWILYRSRSTCWSAGLSRGLMINWKTPQLLFRNGLIPVPRARMSRSRNSRHAVQLHRILHPGDHHLAHKVLTGTVYIALARSSTRSVIAHPPSAVPISLTASPV